MAGKELLIGIADAGVMHADPAEFDIDTWAEVQAAAAAPEPAAVG